MNVALIISAILGAIVAASCVTAVIMNEDRYDWLDRLCIAGLGTSMLLTTPALFFVTPLDAWSFNLSRAFLAGIFAKRFLLPLVWRWQGDRRQQRAIQDALHRRGLKQLHDREQDWL